MCLWLPSREKEMVDDHVQGVGQDQQQDQGGDEAHQDGWCQEGGTVACRRKLPRGVYVRGLVLEANRLTGIHRLLRRKRSLCQVQLLLLVIAHRQFPGLEQEARLPVGQHLIF
ncbi:hypothetical protein INR49_001846 [Caranx melampygus]|nr:hypothetical protein INR49_001846 [Caranx melampygus]